MPNPNAPFGAIPVRKLDGGNIVASKYTLASGQVAYRGDFLTLGAAGTVSVATAGAELIGVAAEYVDATGGAKSILVYDDPSIVFAVRAGSTTAINSDDVGINANIGAGAGNTATKISGHYLDASTKATTNTLNLRVLGLLERPDNDWGTYAIVECLINTHRMTNRTGV